MDRTRATLTVLVLLALALALGGGGLPSIVGKPLVVMMYEANHGPLPQYAIGAARELADSGFEVRMVDDDVLAGDATTPKPLLAAIEQGRVIMGGASDEQQKDDALILVRGNSVKGSKLPPTREEIVSAVK